MSNALAIAGVTAVLRDLLNDGMINHNVSGVLGSTVTVSALPPDRVMPANGSESTQLNLFLHRLTPNPGWRNNDLPSRDSSGRNRLANPPLALDLHYLLTAYSADELGAEILLGYAMQLLHENPVLDRRAITTALSPSPAVGTALPAALQALADCGLADQLEQVKLVPEFLSTEEMSKLWSAVQSHYRPTTAYLATVVLIDSTLPTRASLPVLTRGVAVAASLLPPFPTIESVTLTSKQPVATVGATLELIGHHLDGSARTVVFANSRFAIEQQVSATPGNSTSSIQVVVPDVPAGVYQVAAHLVRPQETESRTSNQLATIIGPQITTSLPMSVARDAAGAATISLNCQPAVMPGQQVFLLLGADQVSAQPFAATTNALTFRVDGATPGEHLVRLRIDGIDSPLIDRLATPPVFFNHRITVT
ncbi:MAG TPA: DUF4255 domain-containing protein [Povalibacter sp.]